MSFIIHVSIHLFVPPSNLRFISLFILLPALCLHVSVVYFSLYESWQRFCLLKKDYMESFEAIFQEQYETIHRLETNKLRNVARLFAHLLYTDSVPWSVSDVDHFLALPTNQTHSP